MEVLPVDRQYLDSRGVRDGIAFVLLWNDEKELLKEIRDLLMEIADLLTASQNIEPKPMSVLIDADGDCEVQEG